MVGIARRPFDPCRARLDEDDLPPGRRARPRRARAGVRRRRRGRAPGVHDHRHGRPRHDPRDQRRGHVERFRAAAAAGAKRFVYASSVAAYGFHRDNPVRMTEDWPVRPAAHLFYAQEKAEIEAPARRGGRRPSGARPLPAAPAGRARPARGRRQGAAARPARAAWAAGSAGSCAARPFRSRCSPRRCRSSSSTRRTSARRSCSASSPPARPGAYNITGDGVLTGAEVARELGLAPLPIPGGLVQGARARARRAAVRPACRRLGRGGQPPGDHGREQGQARARVGAALHEPRGAARHARRSMKCTPFEVDVAIVGSGFSGLGMAIRSSGTASRTSSCSSAARRSAARGGSTRIPAAPATCPRISTRSRSRPTPTGRAPTPRQPEIRATCAASRTRTSRRAAPAPRHAP